MKILILAAGRVGRQLVSQALERGHDLTALVRDPRQIAPSYARLKVLRGDALNPSDAERAVQEQEADLLAGCRE